ncbi:MAG: GNAT family N-acetyltransferase [Gammaproteobacteria bacterium]|nr:GNAT family N-acetyltransferase [Gammaproteobacteria bacterium]
MLRAPDPCGSLALSPNELPRLTSARLELRPFEAGDVDALYAMFSDPEITRFWSSAAMTCREDAVALIEEIEDYCRRGELMEWALVRRDQAGLIGTCSLGNLDRVNRRAEIGFALARPAWGHGFMAEMLPVLVDYAFDTLDLHRLEADVDPRNSGSIRLLRGLGFQLEGRLRERWQVTGEVQDALFYGLLAREWRARADATAGEGQSA